MNDETLLKVLNGKRKVLLGNYRHYFKELSSNPDITIRLIYWGFYEKMKEITISSYKRSKMNERASVLCKILCFQKMEGWVNISQPAEWDKLQEFKADYDLKVKLWVNEKVIQEGLRGLIQLD